MFPEAKPRGTLRSRGNKTHCRFPEGQVIKCFVIPPNLKIEKKNCEIMICVSDSRAELSCRNDVITITVYFFAAKVKTILAFF